MRAKGTLERDWSSLLPEVLNFIAKNLSEVSDFVRFRAVCKAWRLSTPITDLSPKFPWILVYESNKQDLECYSILSNKLYIIHAPKCLNCLWGTSGGYALDSFTKQDKPFLLNPLNNHEIHLPDIDFNYYYREFYLWKNQMEKFVVCCVYCDPSWIRWKLGFWQLGQNNWCQLNIELGSLPRWIFYLKNMFFIVERETGVTKAIDMDTGTLVYVIPPAEEYSTEDDQYMAEASGDIFRVIVRSPGFYFSQFSERIDVYQLDADKIGSPCWVKVTSIGNRALFIDWHILILTANDFTGIKRNSIYFFVYKEDHTKCEECDVKRMDIETGAVEYLPKSIKKPGYWFVPDLCEISGH